MKTVLLLLIVLAAALRPARALRCHVCASSTNCKKPQSCSASARYCRTVTNVEHLSGNLVEKDCAETCRPTYPQPGQVSSGVATTQCCQDDLCNERLVNGAPGRPLLAGAALGLGLALGLLALTVGPSL
ncbi:lymphocyte antigen 6D [Eptesicus fuscus]|uniref:lymphocyte antigen 6D n=1 Tax=Eptesicus fuscus TaxID=29078 RepID=UPI0024049028|nr:lymphocyte antigen 6D [Eptesicus fuscus]